MKMKPLIAEAIGTFVLSLTVYLSVTGNGWMTPMLAGLALGLSVYTIGSISGAHINPAVTLGLLSIKKISLTHAVAYIAAQCVGATVAMKVGHAMLGAGPELIVANTPLVWVAEALGAAVLLWSICAVVFHKTPEAASGLTIGTGLFLGILIAAGGGNGVVNPAVALAIGSPSLGYILGPVIGAVVGCWGYKMIQK